MLNFLKSKIFDGSTLIFIVLLIVYITLDYFQLNPEQFFLAYILAEILYKKYKHE